jgi:uncharacterized protein (TIGR02677 family)
VTVEENYKPTDDGVGGDSLAHAPVPRGGFAEQKTLAYAVGQYAERHRRIMHVFYLNKKRDIGWQLSVTDVQRRLREEFEYELDLATLESALETLESNGNLNSQPNTRDAATPTEWRRRRNLYDITSRGERVEELLADLDALRDEASALESWRLLTIRDSLRRLSAALQAGSPDAQRASEDLEQVIGSVAALRKGATDFMNRLHRFTSTDKVSSEEFLAHQDAVVEHLQDFHRALRAQTDAIMSEIEKIDRLGAGRLVDLALSARQLPVALPGQDAEALRRQVRDDELHHWHGLRSWFGADGAGDAPWTLLTRKLLDSVHAIIDVADRVIARGADRRDRTAAWTRLARIIAASPEAEARAAFAVAVGIAPARHFSGAEVDPDQVPAPGATAWRDAPAAPLAAHLRRPGARAPGGGTPARLRANPQLADRVRARQAAEREQLRRLLARLEAGADLHMSDLHTLHPVELEHLLGWIARAFTQRRGPDGSRTATSADGRTRLRLTPPTDGTRTRIDALHGLLEAPDYRIEVLR